MAERRTELGDAEAFSPVERYAGTERFAREMSSIFRKVPLIAALGSELAGPGSCLARDWVGDFPLLLTRDRDGRVHAFANTCRHRGARLVETGSRSVRQITCPYHAWTYGLDGRLRGVPHAAAGFPSLDMPAVRLKELTATEAFGFVWVTMDPDGASDVPAHLAGLGEDLDWIGAQDHELFAEDVRDWAVNWKIVVEGGLESYHFKIAHKDTIAPLFNDNLSVHDWFGPHIRSVLTKAALGDVAEMPEADWTIREVANLLYTLHPCSVLLLQPDHFALIDAMPLGPESTRIAVRTFIPAGSAETDKARAHWHKNHTLTVETLNEDFSLGERIQHGIRSGANDAFRFGRFEQALDRFHRAIEARLE
jgi:phenylpropionate dioxygenase-like ring-hydroxylating dioxygenase large terminal subunit